MYDLHGIRLVKAPLTLQLTEKQRARIAQELRDRLPALLKALRKREVVVFVDECVFTDRSLLEKTWRKRDQHELIAKPKLSFNAIAVLGGITTEGRLVSFVIRECSIDLDAFQDFAEQVRKKFG